MREQRLFVYVSCREHSVLPRLSIAATLARTSAAGGCHAKAKAMASQAAQKSTKVTIKAKSRPKIQARGALSGD